MDEVADGAAGALLRDLFRFHLEIDQSGRVTSTGAALKKIAPGLEGAALSDIATSDTMLVPIRQDPSLEWCDVLMRLRFLSKDVGVRGAFVPSPFDGHLLFLGSLDPEDCDRLDELGLQSTDFSPTDLTLDFSMLRWARDAQVRETKGALARLEASIARGRHLEELVAVDALTELPNRVAFSSRLEDLLAERPIGLTVVMVDVNRFKLINDRFGHSVGDEALRTVADHLRMSVGSSGVAARLGGDEFAIVLFESADVDKIVRSISALGERVLTIDGNRMTIALTLGVAPRTDEVSGSVLLGHADIAMYEARSAQVAVAWFDPDDRAQLDLRRSVADALPSALRDAEISLAFQPIVDLTDSRMHGFEVLSRWNHPTMGAISPELFIDVAERTRQIQELDEYVVARSMGSAFDLVLDGELPRLNVNLSAMSLTPRMVDYLAGLIADYDFPATKLTIEVTETASVADLTHTAQILHAMHEMGISVALDDFGTGFASLTYLQALPVDVVKIDRSFVADMVGSEKSLQLVRSVVQVAQALELTVTAEGIETVEQQMLLRSLGVDRAQGYLFARPVDLAGARTMLGRVLPLGTPRPPAPASGRASATSC